MVITQRQEEILSWLCGLSPIGLSFACERRHAAADLGLNNPSVFNHDLKRLADIGAVIVESKGLHGIPSRLRVLQRPEAYTVVTAPKRVRYVGYDEMEAA